jgi:PBC domain
MKPALFSVLCEIKEKTVLSLRNLNDEVRPVTFTVFPSISDPHTLYADPDPAFLTNSDPDPIQDPSPS